MNNDNVVVYGTTKIPFIMDMQNCTSITEAKEYVENSKDYLVNFVIVNHSNGEIFVQTNKEGEPVVDPKIIQLIEQSLK